MNIRGYLKQVWNDILHDELGEYQLPTDKTWIRNQYPVESFKSNIQKAWDFITGSGIKGTASDYTNYYPQATDFYTPPTGYDNTPTNYDNWGSGAQGQAYSKPALPNIGGSGAQGQAYITPTPTGGTETGTGDGTGTVEDVFGTPTPDFPTSSGGGGGGNWLADIGIEAPDFSWNPSGEQLAGWQSEAAKRAGLEFDPQLEEVARGLERFRNTIAAERPRVKSRYDQQNLAVANIIANTVKQGVVEDAIRRGATTSGELPRQTAMAGREEVQRRSEIEQDRNTTLDELRNALLQQEQEASDARKQIEKLRGMKQAVSYADLERQARSRQMEELSTEFQGELDVVGLQNAVAASQAQAEYNNAMLAAQREQAAWDQQYRTQQAAYSNAQNAYNRQPSPMEQVELAIREAELASIERENREAERYNQWMMDNVYGSGGGTTQTLLPNLY